MMVGFSLLSHEKAIIQRKYEAMYVLWLVNLNVTRGHSWAGRWRTSDASHRIPAGFCLTTLAYDLAMARVHRSLKRGGRLLISEFIPDEERSSAVVPLLFASLELIVNQRETHLQ